ncbi:unnamed protein product [Prunus brigantina]
MWDSLSFAWIGLGVLGQILYKQESPKFSIKEHRCRVVDSWHRCRKLKEFSMCRSAGSFGIVREKCLYEVSFDMWPWRQKLRGFSIRCRSAGSFGVRYLMGGVVQHVALRKGAGEVSPMGCRSATQELEDAVGALGAAISLGDDAIN